MGPSIDTTSRTSIQPGQGASEPTFQYKTKDKTVPKKQMQPGMDPIIPGKVKEQNRYTGPEQRVVQKPNSNVKMKAPYDKSTFDQSALERLYPSLFEQKSPNQISKFTDWLKGLHQKYLAKPQPEVQAPQPMATEARKEILSLVKTAVQDSNNNYKIALQALHEMGYTSENILKALTSKKSR
jgi:truncated hemoglobin YjbI